MAVYVSLVLLCAKIEIVSGPGGRVGSVVLLFACCLELVQHVKVSLLPSCMVLVVGGQDGRPMADCCRSPISWPRLLRAKRLGERNVQRWLRHGYLVLVSKSENARATRRLACIEGR